MDTEKGKTTNGALDEPAEIRGTMQLGHFARAE
jgi:hypothetical protein